MLDEWDYWAGTFGLVVFAVIETMLFMLMLKPENAWRSLHLGADMRIPRIFKFVMTYITPAYLLVILVWWGVTDALPILRLTKDPNGNPYAPDSMVYVHASRAIMLAFVIGFVVLVRLAWKRNRYVEREGFVEVEDRPMTGVAA